MNGFYRLRPGTPEIVEVVCPKNKLYMQEMQNGFFGERLWYCQVCDSVYRLKPSKLKETEFDRDELNKQLAALKELKP